MITAETSQLYSTADAPIQSGNPMARRRNNPSALTDPKVSVVIPVFNEKDTIDEILRRVLETQARKEIIVVDDSSSDGTRQRLKAMEGLRAKDIADRLEISPKTVDTYRASLMRKLNVPDLVSLVKFAIERNLTSTSPQRAKEYTPPAGWE